MRPNNVIDATVEGNLGGETVKMEIDPTATAHLMSVLTDLYSDRIMAFIREYATNAYDAQLEAGVSRPIEITLPNRMESYYRVKDYGIGLDVEGIRDIYSKYGASTKRDSDLFNGMLGLGCKSAMTYAAQFSIISVKDGMKHNVAVSRGLDGVGEMQVIDSTPTTESNGVEIVIPVKNDDHWSVKAKVAEFFQWWPEGSVLVNGIAPKRTVGREVLKNVYMVDGMERDLVVMGNVAYPLPDGYSFWDANVDRYGYSRKDFSVVYFAEMGEVTFSPSRESLSTVKNTRETLARVRSQFAEHMMKSLQADIDKEKSILDALNSFVTMRSRYQTLDLSGLTYKGHAFPSEGIEAPFKMVAATLSAYDASRGIKPSKVKAHDHFLRYDAHGGSKESIRNSLDLDTIRGLIRSGVIVLNSPKSLTTGQRTKIRRAFDADIFPHANVLLVQQNKIPDDFWLAGVDVIDWSAIRDFKDTTALISDRTKHSVHETNGSIEHRAVPDDEKIVYASPTEFNTGYGYRSWSSSSVSGVANQMGYSFVLMGKNRHTKFKREHKNALTSQELMKMYVENYDKSLSDSDKWLLGVETEDMSRLVALKSHVDIADPSMVALVNKADSARRSALINERQKIQNKIYGSGQSIKEVKSVRPFNEYKILTHIPARDYKNCAADISAYIKAVYNNGKKGK
jgi:hypothetical protein